MSMNLVHGYPSGLLVGAGDNLKIHSAASQRFTDIQSLPDTLDPQSFEIIGVLGTSINYTTTGQVLKSGFRIFGIRKSSIHRRYDLAYQCLTEYSNDWKETRKVYRNREPLKARKVIKPQEASIRGRAVGWWRRQQTQQHALQGHEMPLVRPKTPEANPLQDSNSSPTTWTLLIATYTPSSSTHNSPRLPRLGRSPGVEQARQREIKSPGSSTLNSSASPFDPANERPLDSAPYDVPATRPATPADTNLKLSLLQLGALFALMKQSQGPAAVKSTHSCPTF
jgi:hypothetical protein